MFHKTLVKLKNLLYLFHIIIFQILSVNKSFQLSQILKSIITKISYEDVVFISTHILQCAANIMTVKNILNSKENSIFMIFQSVNGPLQGRTEILNADSNRINITTDCHICKDFS